MTFAAIHRIGAETVAMMSAIIFGAFPARRAARPTPIEALRDA